jgi:hypothetical protein
MPAVEAAWSPPNLGGVGKGKGGRVLYMDSSIVPGAMYMECVWFCRGLPTRPLCRAANGRARNRTRTITMR